MLIVPCIFYASPHTSINQRLKNFYGDLKSVYDRYTGDSFCGPDFFVLDADDAESNSVQTIYPRAKILICWFHVKMNCSDK
jgi:hypothetical protein